MAGIIPPIGTKKLAEKLGIHRKNAWVRLRRMRDKHGDRIVTQDGPGRSLRTSLRALKEADPHIVEMKELEREEVEQIVAKRFRSRTTALEKRVSDLEDSNKSLQLQVNSLRETAELLLRGLRAVTKSSD